MLKGNLASGGGKQLARFIRTPRMEIEPRPNVFLRQPLTSLIRPPRLDSHISGCTTIERER